MGLRAYLKGKSFTDIVFGSFITILLCFLVICMFNLAGGLHGGDVDYEAQTKAFKTQLQECVMACPMGVRNFKGMERYDGAVCDCRQ